nr:hypothetical protein [Herbaspirillum sp. ASV7]
MSTKYIKQEMERQLESARDAVVDEVSFINFLNVLSADWFAETELHAASPQSPYSAGALGWENGCIGTFLQASARWVENSRNDLQFYEVPANPWRRVADIMFMGKIYD